MVHGLRRCFFPTHMKLNRQTLLEKNLMEIKKEYIAVQPS